MTIPFLKLWLSETQWRVTGNRGPFASRLRESGVFVDPDQLSTSDCAATRQCIDALIADGCEDLWVDEAGSDHRIWNYEKYEDGIVQRLGVPAQLEAIEAYLGRSIRKWFLMANRVDPVVGNLGSGGGLHRDSSFARQVKVIWYLNDVDEANGPFSYLPGSAMRLSIAGQKSYDDRLDHMRHLVDGDMLSIPGRVGSRITADTRGIHMGQPATERARYTVTLYTEYGFLSL